MTKEKRFELLKLLLMYIEMEEINFLELLEGKITLDGIIENLMQDYMR